MYLDTSVLLKLFVKEPDSDFFGKMTDGELLSSSVLAYTEIWSALLAKERAGAITVQLRRRAWRSFEYNVDEELIELVPLSPAIFRRANRIMDLCHSRVPLRSLDALHLASCDQAQDWPLVANDKRVRSAAAIMNFPLAPAD